MYRVPSVAMNGATLKRVTSSPFTSPTIVPTASDTMTITHTGGYRIDVEQPTLDALEQLRGDDAGKSDDRADRQVDATLQDDEQHAQSEDRVDRDVLASS